MPARFLFLIAILCLPAIVHAQPEGHPQPEARFQVYGGYSYISNTLNGVPGSRKALNGWDASIACPSWHGLRFKIDMPGYRGTNLNAQEHFYFIMGGAQLSHRFGREVLYAEGVAGDGGANKYWGANGQLGQTVAFASYIGGGLDTPIGKSFAIRVDGGYQYSYFALDVVKTLVPYEIPGLPTNFGRISSGLVWQF